MAQYGLAENPLIRATETGLQGALQRRNQTSNKVMAYEFGKKLAHDEGAKQAKTKELAFGMEMFTGATTIEGRLKWGKFLVNKGFDSGILNDLEEAQRTLRSINKEGEVEAKTKGRTPEASAKMDLFLNSLGGEFSSVTDTAERLRESSKEGREQDSLAQGITLDRQIGRTPGLSDSPEALEYAEKARTELLAGGGTAGTDILKSDFTKDSSRVAQNYRLPDGTIGLSYDGGRTIVGPDGVVIPTPPGTIKVPGGATLKGMKSAELRRQAAEDLKGRPPARGLGTTPESAARGGTGPYRMLASAIDRVAGGLGVDAAFGKKGIFPDTQQNRQILRTIKQVGKAALINSPRFPIAEQKTVDRLFADPDVFFTNPRTEAKKFQVLRNVMMEVKDLNNRAMVKGGPDKELEKLWVSNLEIDRFLSLIGTGDEGGAVGSTTTVTMPDGSTQTFDESGKRVK